MNKKVSFAERVALMNTAVAALRDILRIVADEASAMAEVQLSPEKSLEDVSEEDLRFYLDDMVSKRNLSVATVRRRLACLRGSFVIRKNGKK